MSGQLKQKLTRPSIWLRLIYMIILAIAFNIAEILVFAVVVFQFLVTLFTRNPNDQLLRFGKSLSIYVQQVVAYLTFTTEDKPFPFSSWPDGGQSGSSTSTASSPVIIENEATEEDKQPAPKRRKPAPKKTSTPRVRKSPPKSDS